MLVDLRFVLCCSWHAWAYQLGVEFGQPGLAVVVEDEDCVDHCRFVYEARSARIVITSLGRVKWRSGSGSVARCHSQS